MLEVSLTEDLGFDADANLRGFDPVQADCLLHALITGFMNSKFDLAGLALLPVRIERLQVLIEGATLSTGRLTVRRRGNQSILVDVMGFDSDGAPAVFMKGLRLQAVSLMPQIDFTEHAYHFAAVPCLPVRELPVLDAEKAEAALTTVLSDDVPEDDTYLLMNAATNQAIWSAFDAVVRADRHYVIRETFEKTEVIWLERLAGMGLASKDVASGNWLIAEVMRFARRVDNWFGVAG